MSRDSKAQARAIRDRNRRRRDAQGERAASPFMARKPAGHRARRAAATERRAQARRDREAREGRVV